MDHYKSKCATRSKLRSTPTEYVVEMRRSVQYCTPRNMTDCQTLRTGALTLSAFTQVSTRKTVLTGG